VRILIVTDCFWPEPSPPAAHVHDRAKLWAADGHDVTVVTNVPNYPEGRFHDGYRNLLRQVELRDGVRIVRVMTYATPNTGLLRRLLDYLSFMVTAGLFAPFERRPDVVFSTSPQLFASVAAAWTALLRRRPHVMEVRDLWPASVIRSRGLVYRVLERVELTLYRHAARVIALTPSFIDDMARRGVPRDKIDLVVNGAALDLFHPHDLRDAELQRDLELDGHLTIGYPGTLATAHDIENLLETAELLADQPVRFVVVGGGPVKARLEELARRRCPDRFRFVPTQPRDAMPRYWSLFDWSLVLLRNEPVLATVIPSKIFESMASGVPVLFVGPRGDASALIDAEGVGRCVDAGDPNRFAEAIRRLVAECRPGTPCHAALRSRALERAPNWSRTRQAESTMRSLLLATGREPHDAPNGSPDESRRSRNAVGEITR